MGKQKMTATIAAVAIAARLLPPSLLMALVRSESSSSLLHVAPSSFDDRSSGEVVSSAPSETCFPSIFGFCSSDALGVYSLLGSFISSSMLIESPLSFQMCDANNCDK